MKLRRGTTVVGTRAVRVRAGRSVTVRVKVLAEATIAASGRQRHALTAAAPRALRVTLLTT